MMIGRYNPIFVIPVGDEPDIVSTLLTFIYCKCNIFIIRPFVKTNSEIAILKIPKINAAKVKQKFPTSTLCIKFSFEIYKCVFNSKYKILQYIT